MATLSEKREGELDILIASYKGKLNPTQVAQKAELEDELIKVKAKIAKEKQDIVDAKKQVKNASDLETRRRRLILAKAELAKLYGYAKEAKVNLSSIQQAYNIIDNLNTKDVTADNVETYLSQANTLSGAIKKLAENSGKDIDANVKFAMARGEALGLGMSQDKVNEYQDRFDKAGASYDDKIAIVAQLHAASQQYAGRSIEKNIAEQYDAATPREKISMLFDPKKSELITTKQQKLKDLIQSEYPDASETFQRIYATYPELKNETQRRNLENIIDNAAKIQNGINNTSKRIDKEIKAQEAAAKKAGKEAPKLADKIPTFTYADEAMESALYAENPIKEINNIVAVKKFYKNDPDGEQKYIDFLNSRKAANKLDTDIKIRENTANTKAEIDELNKLKSDQKSLLSVSTGEADYIAKRKAIQDIQDEINKTSSTIKQINANKSAKSKAYEGAFQLDTLQDKLNSLGNTKIQAQFDLDKSKTELLMKSKGLPESKIPALVREIQKNDADIKSRTYTTRDQLASVNAGLDRYKDSQSGAWLNITDPTKIQNRNWLENQKKTLEEQLDKEAKFAQYDEQTRKFKEAKADEKLQTGIDAQYEPQVRPVNQEEIKNQAPTSELEKEAAAEMALPATQPELPYESDSIESLKESLALYQEKQKEFFAIPKEKFSPGAYEKTKKNWEEVIQSTINRINNAKAMRGIKDEAPEVKEALTPEQVPVQETPVVKTPVVTPKVEAPETKNIVKESQIEPNLLSAINSMDLKQLQDLQSKAANMPQMVKDKIQERINVLSQTPQMPQYPNLSQKTGYEKTSIKEKAKDIASEAKDFGSDVIQGAKESAKYIGDKSQTAAKYIGNKVLGAEQNKMQQDISEAENINKSASNIKEAAKTAVGKTKEWMEKNPEFGNALSGGVSIQAPQPERPVIKPKTSYPASEVIENKTENIDTVKGKPGRPGIGITPETSLEEDETLGVKEKMSTASKIAKSSQSKETESKEPEMIVAPEPELVIDENSPIDEQIKYVKDKIDIARISMDKMLQLPMDNKDIQYQDVIKKYIEQFQFYINKAEIKLDYLEDVKAEEEKKNAEEETNIANNMPTTKV